MGGFISSRASFIYIFIIRSSLLLCELIDVSWREDDYDFTSYCSDLWLSQYSLSISIFDFLSRLSFIVVVPVATSAEKTRSLSLSFILSFDLRVRSGDPRLETSVQRS